MLHNIFIYKCKKMETYKSSRFSKVPILSGIGPFILFLLTDLNVY